MSHYFYMCLKQGIGIFREATFRSSQQILRWVDHSQLKFKEDVGIDFKPKSILENIGPYEITRRFREDQWLT